jgi:DNA-binding NtrC family response regulator
MISNDDNESGWILWDVYPKIQRAAAVNGTVLILGESSTARRLAAQALHENGPRKREPFVTVNCAAVPATNFVSEFLRGFEQADGGVLFIDEIAALAQNVQAELLRVLDTLSLTPNQKVNVRVLAATGAHILQMVKDGKFREDLYYRLNVITIQLHGLRESTRKG